MNRLWRFIRSLNWRYIIGEVVLIFLGINLAIWFNNWNSSTKLTADKEVALQTIEEEIRSNQEELMNARQANMLTLAALEEMSEIYVGEATSLERSPAEMQTLLQRFPAYFAVQDSTALDDGRFAYEVAAGVQMELPELTSIAWKTAQSLNVAAKLNYNCLYELEKTYNLQEQVEEGIDRAVTALENRDMRHLTNVLSFVGQIDTLLIVNYEELLQNIGDCQ